MHRWETRMLLKHYLERGVSKTELSRRFGVSRRTIHEWIETGQLDRDVSLGGARYTAPATDGAQAGSLQGARRAGGAAPLGGATLSAPRRRLGHGTGPAKGA